MVLSLVLSPAMVLTFDQFFFVCVCFISGDGFISGFISGLSQAQVYFFVLFIIIVRIVSVLYASFNIKFV